MSETRVFECPSCGAQLTTDGSQAQIKCEYCGNVVMVPEELRIKPASPPQAPPGKEQLAEAFINLATAAERAAEERAVEERVVEERERLREARPVARRSRSGCGCLLPLLIAAGIFAVASGLVPGLNLPPQVRELLGIVVPTATPAPVNRPLRGVLPRQVSYASLAFKVTAATVTNLVPGNSSQAPRYRSDQAYADLDVSVTNPLTTKSVFLESDAITLQLANGKTYAESSGWGGNIDRQATVDGRLVFTLPPDATLQGAKLIIAQAGKEPATLPLDGPAPVASYPIKLASGGHATAGSVNYTVLSATVDLDADGQRADTGKRFLILNMRVENTSSFRGGMALGGDYFRLLVDGVPQAPIVAPSELINAQSAIEGSVAFLMPATATKVDLQVGEVGQEKTAIIPISLKGGG